ncbi:MAG: hypothetical protein HDR39_00240 [Treponema sp.]|nr:hypothetical protein [Treponema sp.]
MTRDGLTGITIRNEAARDFSEVERLTREAFWNVHVPGCSEHYLAHILRTHGDFVPELDLVAEAADGTLAGNVMYTTSRITGDGGGWWKKAWRARRAETVCFFFRSCYNKACAEHIVLLSSLF